MRRDHLDAVLAQLLIEWIAVVGAIADQILRLGLDHVEVEAQLYQPNFVVIGGMRADRERQSMTIHDRHDFHAFPALRRSDPNPATLRHHERRIDEAFRFVQDVHRECALPENDSGCAPTARLSAESSDIYSRSTPPSNFEIGSSNSAIRGQPTDTAELILQTMLRTLKAMEGHRDIILAR